MGEIGEDYESAMSAAHLAQREAKLGGLVQSAQQSPTLDEQCDSGLCVAVITFQAVGEFDRRRPRGIPGRT